MIANAIKAESEAFLGTKVMDITKIKDYTDIIKSTPIFDMNAFSLGISYQYGVFL